MYPLEYYALVTAERSPDRIFPPYEEYKAAMQPYLGTADLETVINDLVEKGFLNKSQHNRIELTSEGAKYMDNTYWMELTFKYIDHWLANNQDKPGMFYNISKRDVQRIEDKFRAIMEGYDLIEYTKPYDKRNSLVKITEEGRSVINACGGIVYYLQKVVDEKQKEILKVEEKEDLELQKLRTEVSLITNQLSDYEKVKNQSRNANRIAIFAAIVTLIGIVLQWKGCMKP